MSKKVLRTVQLALLAAIIILLQQLVIPLPGGLTLSLVLVPIVVGAVLFGPAAGAGLGGVFGLVVSFLVITGRAGALSEMMWVAHPVLTIAICMLKGIVAGWVAGLMPRLCKTKPFGGVLLAAAAAPIVNTGIFTAGLLLGFSDVVVKFAAEIGMAGQSVLYIAVVGIVGINFLVEFAANVVLSPAIASIIRAVRKNT